MPSRDMFRFSALLSFPLALLLASAGLGGLVLPDVYARETPSWAAQGVGQDWVDLVVVAPALALCAIGVLGGSRRARLLIGGLLAYSAYSLVLYAFAVHFNSLFLVYSAALGFAFYALVGTIVALRSAGVETWFADRAPMRTCGGLTALVGVLFYLLWLGEVVPALAAHEMPRSLQEVGLITNPVQVLDIGIVLPAFVAGGLALARRRPPGHWLAPVMLAFGVVMSLALIGMAVSMSVRHLPGGGPPPVALVGLTVLTAAPLWALLRRVRP